MVDVVCIASGPSTRPEDLELVRDWRARTGKLVIVSNSMIFLCEWADCLFAADAMWIHQYREWLTKWDGKCYTTSASMHRKFKILPPPFNSFNNSGTGCISLAKQFQAKKIVLLGYDLSADGAKKHMHKDHPKPLMNCNSMVFWPDAFNTQAKQMKGIEVINCSRKSILACYPKSTLEKELVASA